MRAARSRSTPGKRSHPSACISILSSLLLLCRGRAGRCPRGGGAAAAAVCRSMPLRHHFPSFSPPLEGPLAVHSPRRSSCSACHTLSLHTIHPMSHSIAKTRPWVWSSPKQGFLRLFAPQRGLGGWWATDGGWFSATHTPLAESRGQEVKLRKQGKKRTKMNQNKSHTAYNETQSFLVHDTLIASSLFFSLCGRSGIYSYVMFLLLSLFSA